MRLDNEVRPCLITGLRRDHHHGHFGPFRAATDSALRIGAAAAQGHAARRRHRRGGGRRTGRHHDRGGRIGAGGGPAGPGAPARRWRQCWPQAATSSSSSAATTTARSTSCSGSTTTGGSPATSASAARPPEQGLHHQRALRAGRLQERELPALGPDPGHRSQRRWRPGRVLLDPEQRLARRRQLRLVLQRLVPRGRLPDRQQPQADDGPAARRERPRRRGRLLPQRLGRGPRLHLQHQDAASSPW